MNYVCRLRIRFSYRITTKCGWADRQTDRRTDRQTDRQTDRVITIGLPHLRWRGPNNIAMTSKLMIIQRLWLALEQSVGVTTVYQPCSQAPVRFPLPFSSSRGLFRPVYYVCNSNINTTSSNANRAYPEWQTNQCEALILILFT